MCRMFSGIGVVRKYRIAAILRRSFFFHFYDCEKVGAS